MIALVNLLLLCSYIFMSFSHSLTSFVFLLAFMQQDTKVLKIGTEIIINDGDFLKDNKIQM